MQDYFILALWKVVKHTRFRETVWLEVMPSLVTKVSFVKINMKYTYFGIGLIQDTCTFFLQLGYLECIQDALRKHVAYQCFVIEC